MLIKPVGEKAGSIGAEKEATWDEDDILVEAGKTTTHSGKSDSGGNLKMPAGSLRIGKALLGSVRCHCAPTAAVGQCYTIQRDQIDTPLRPRDLTPNEKLTVADKADLEQRHLEMGAGFCPAMGVLRPCHPGSQIACDAPPMMIRALRDPPRAPVGAREFALSPFKCKLEGGCGPGTDGPDPMHQRCDCLATGYQSCTFSTEECPHTPHLIAVDAMQTSTTDGPQQTLQCAKDKDGKPEEGSAWCF